ncbi:MAG: DUF3597 domain-containing protein [Anaerolineales bacterium]|nr:DUF3597 domain-containing protein [Anaerolineales bacterium]
MSLFSKILNKLGFDKPEAEAAPEVKPAVHRTAAAVAAERAKRLERITTARASKAIPVVDVMAKLEKLAAEKPMQSNWKVSIADLLFLLGLDHSYEARKELAVELGCPTEYMDDSAKMNTWLHKTVLEKLAENGGNIPMELLD